MTKNLLKILYALIYLILPSICSANCTKESAFSAAVSDGYKPKTDFLITCKVMPGNQQKTIIAFARKIGSYNYTLIVFIVNKKTGKVINRFIDEDPSFGPNGYPVKIEIDTAKYFVAPNKRAFGVRVTHSLNSWDSTEDLNLFLEDENGFSEILKGLTVRFSSSHACYSNAIGVVISISKFTTENYFDLILTKKESSIEGLINANNGECTSSDPITSTTEKAIHFKDGAYHMP